MGMPHGSRTGKFTSIEHQIRAKSRKEDRITFALGFALSVGSSCFFAYAYENSGDFQRAALAFPRIALGSGTGYPAAPVQKVAVIPEVTSTGSLARSQAGTLGSETVTPKNPAPEAGLTAYTIRRAFHGFATLDGPSGTIDVIPGVEVPGAGRVVAIRQINGQWVVETSEGTILANAG